MTRTLLLPLVLLAGLAGCSTYEELYQPAEYTPVTEMKPGPGMFTGESGVYTLFGGGGGDDDKAAGASEDGDAVDGKPGEPVVIKRRRP
jgi:hypothetical protein